MIVLVALMMFAMPMASAQIPATPVGDDPQATEPSDPGDGSTGIPPGSENEGEAENPSAGEEDESSLPAEGGEAASTPTETSTEPAGETPDETVPPGNGETNSTPESGEPTESSGPAETGTPASTPGMQRQSRGISIMATVTLTINVVTSDEGPVPAGTQVCIITPDAGCETVSGSTAEFIIENDVTYVYYTLTPPAGSDYVDLHDDAYDSLYLEGAGDKQATVTLTKKATVNVTLQASGGVPDGSKVCLYPNTSEVTCQTYPTDPLVFSVPPGEVPYTAGTTTEPQLIARDAFTIGAGETKDLTITLQAEGRLDVSVTTADGGAVPDPMLLCLDATMFTEGCTQITGGTYSRPSAAGTVRYGIPLWQSSPYRGVSGTIEVTPGAPTTLNIVLERKDPAKIRVFVETEDNAPVPEGTEICIDMPALEQGDPVNHDCQTFAEPFVTFTTSVGGATVTVTPPEGSGYKAESFTAYTGFDYTARVVFTLERTVPAAPTNAEITISLEDGPLDPDNNNVSACMYPEGTDLLSCVFPSSSAAGNGGSLVFTWEDVSPGDYEYVVFENSGTYGSAKGTLTVTPGDTAQASVMLPRLTEESTATVIVTLATIDGSPVPAGVRACVQSYADSEDPTDPPDIDDVCPLWAGEPLSFTVAPFPIIAVPVIGDLENRRPAGAMLYDFLTPGETREITLWVFSQETQAGITNEVSDVNPQSGDQVTYTIRAWGTSSSEGFGLMSAVQAVARFEIENTLPVELTDVSVSCAGEYMPVVPGSCAEIQNGVLSVAGGYSPNFFTMSFYNITVTVTGTIVGDPDTAVSNTACLSNYSGQQSQFPTGPKCATADLTIAGEPVETATVTFDLTSSDPVAVSAMPAGSTWSLTNVDDPTVAFSGTFTEAQLALPGSITLDQPIPFGPYTLTVDASPAFDVYTQNVTIQNETVALNLAKQGFFQQALPQVTLPIELQVAQVEPTGTPTGTPTETPTGTPTETPTGTPLPATPTPSGTSTPATPSPTGTPAQPNPATPEGETPAGSSPVTGLPTTGHDGGNGTSLAIYAGLAAAVLLGGAGLLLRGRQPER